MKYWRVGRQDIAHLKEPASEPTLPALGVYMPAREDIATKAWNLHRKLEEDRVTLIETAAVKPVS